MLENYATSLHYILVTFDDKNDPQSDDVYEYFCKFGNITNVVIIHQEVLVAVKLYLVKYKIIFFMFRASIDTCCKKQHKIQRQESCRKSIKW